MEVTRPLPDESLPSPELEVSTELPETRPNRLRKLANKMRRSEATHAPEAPPPLLVEQLAALQAIKTPEKKPKKPSAEVEVTIEQVPDTKNQRSEARRRLEAVFEQRAEAEPAQLEELPDEARYERRAEVKPAESTMTEEEKGLADSVGKILAELHQRTATAHAAFRRKHKPVAWPVDLPLIGQLPIMYQQAVTSGFIGGIILIVSYIAITSI